jgi:hypothetical protein
MPNTNYPVSPVHGANFTESTTDQRFALGQVLEGANNSQWTYVKSGEAITQYMAVAIDEEFVARKLTKALADSRQTIGFAQFAFSASNTYGWVPTKASGNISVLVKASCAADTRLQTTSSAGVLDDTTTATQTYIDGVVVVVAATSSGTQAEECIATWPKTTL